MSTFHHIDDIQSPVGQIERLKDDTPYLSSDSRSAVITRLCIIACWNVSEQPTMRTVFQQPNGTRVAMEHFARRLSRPKHEASRAVTSTCVTGSK